MKKNQTELVFILDCSGSMCGLESDTIGGFNSLINKQKREKGKVLVTTVLFNQHIRVLHDRCSINKIEPLNDSQYVVQGQTALLDAIGLTVDHIFNIQQELEESKIPEKTLVVVITDGMENSSYRYKYTDIQKKIQEKKEKNHWEFLFLGANIDAVMTAESIGIDRARAVNYQSDEIGTTLNYQVINDTVSMFRNESFENATKILDSGNWKKSIEDDYNIGK